MQRNTKTEKKNCWIKIFIALCFSFENVYTHIFIKKREIPWVRKIHFTPPIFECIFLRKIPDRWQKINRFFC